MSTTLLKYRVPYADTDQMGVVYYANFFVFFERIRNEMLRDIQLTYKSLEESGIMLPVSEAHCDYKFPAKYDDIIYIYSAFTAVKGCRLRVEYILKANDVVLVTGHTVHACIDSQTRKPMKFPDEIENKILNVLEKKVNIV